VKEHEQGVLIKSKKKTAQKPGLGGPHQEIGIRKSWAPLMNAHPATMRSGTQTGPRTYHEVRHVTEGNTRSGFVFCLNQSSISSRVDVHMLGHDILIYLGQGSSYLAKYSRGDQLPIPREAGRFTRRGRRQWGQQQSRGC